VLYISFGDIPFVGELEWKLLKGDQAG
jgi:hypothetical protein